MRRFVALAVAAATLALAGCASTPAAPAEASKPRVVASTDAYGSIASAIGGKYVTVDSIIDDPSKDPHEYEATVRDRLAVSKANLVIVNGGGYDDFMTPLLRAAKPAPTVFDVTTISGADTSAADFNEHFFYDLSVIRVVADRVASLLTQLDRGHAAEFANNRATFLSRLDSLIASQQQLRAHAAGAAVAVTEPVPGYLLAASGLVDRTPPQFSHAAEEGTDAAPAVLSQTLELIEAHQVKLLAYNPQAPSPQVDEVVKAAHVAGVPVVAFTETLPKGMDYLDWMTNNLDRLGAALERG